MVYDKIIIGAGLYGLYAAEQCGSKGERVLVLEYDCESFSRATYINQARVHMGYHYPRSYSTAVKSAHYFHRFMEDFGFCVHTDFRKIYATSSCFSWTNSMQFQRFCQSAEIPCRSISPEEYFNPGLCDGTFETVEYTYDSSLLRNWFLDQISKLDTVTIEYNVRIKSIVQCTGYYEVTLQSGAVFQTDFLLNATYASTNQVTQLLGYEQFGIKYELCEIILCDVSGPLRDVGITVMDGPFFSIMPFGKTGLHSLTSVTFTPHMTSYNKLPSFPCQKESLGYCSPTQLGNCNQCVARPKSAWIYMSHMARKYLRPEYQFHYHSSLYSMKPILTASEIDDSRPTVIKQYSQNPSYYCVLSGKINTVYDLDEILGGRSNATK